MSAPPNSAPKSMRTVSPQRQGTPGTSVPVSAGPSWKSACGWLPPPRRQPLLANIALSVLDEHLHGPWEPVGTMATEGKRAYRRRKGRATWRVVRYADDFVVLVHGTEADTAALREEIADLLEPLGLRLSRAKTRIVHMSDGFDFLSFRIQWNRKGGTTKWHVYKVRGGILERDAGAS